MWVYQWVVGFYLGTWVTSISTLRAFLNDQWANKGEFIQYTGKKPSHAHVIPKMWIKISQIKRPSSSTVWTSARLPFPHPLLGHTQADGGKPLPWHSFLQTNPFSQLVMAENSTNPGMWFRWWTHSNSCYQQQQAPVESLVHINSGCWPP